MLDLNTMHQVNTDKTAYQAFRESADRACGHDLEAKKPEWYMISYVGINLIPGTEAPSVTEYGAEVVIPNEWGIMKQATSIEADEWNEMLAGDTEVTAQYDRVLIVAVFNADGKKIFEHVEV